MQTFVMDPDSQACLTAISTEEAAYANRLPGIKTVLIVMSASGMVFDESALIRQVQITYPDAKVYFMNPDGSALRQEAPSQVDLVIDFSGTSGRQPLFFAKSLRRRARIAIGRNAGLFRGNIYDRTFNEKAESAKLPTEMLSRETAIQKRILALAGISFVRSGKNTPALGEKE